MPESPLVFVSANVIFVRGAKVLVMLRQGTGHRDGMWGLPGGHVEAGEFPTDAAVRELAEETGCTVDRDDLRLVHVMFRIDVDRTYIDYFYTYHDDDPQVTHNPVVAEPDKCGGLQWWQPNDETVDVISHHVDAIWYSRLLVTNSEHINGESEIVRGRR